MSQARNIREVYDGRVYVHLPNDYTTAGFHTMCGLCDVAERVSQTDEPVDCDTCMSVMAHVLLLAASRGVIQSNPRETTLDRARRPAKVRSEGAGS